MAIKKQFLKSKPVCKVTFILPAEEASSVSVIGTFNEWDDAATPLKKLKNGSFKGTIDLESGVSHEFRYLVDGAYINEKEADAFKWSDYAGAENSVLSL
ncbi:MULTISPECIES: isoamylase early set domain-containing protein [unclassified Polaribacter]|uniref:isoamylase early set domain-containing protein n=1 Tax=unclassified Polaribacter TaxID=196858 RepID=UPI0011BD65F4|nr:MULTISPECIES: isoamylase early set domain-containing protein [unclassified Polaribacter]TXD50935.1 glycoside hydrolase [Polaribacter sp. IC063]TXD62272.1 glycoside hydrolase [Polaribacter sp. IC066]